MFIKKVVTIVLFTFLFLGFTIPIISYAQDQTQKSIRIKVSRSEKWWAICHPFIARKALKITNESLQITDSLRRTGKLGIDLNGGQMDAFKHAFWMASLAQEIKWKKAYKLGIAHEKGNYLSYKKGVKKGKTNLPDKRSSDMDLWNNDIGIKIGANNQELSLEELQLMVIESILEGEMRIINKDTQGNFLDCENNIIPPDNLKGKWENEKCLIPSNKLLNN